MFSLDDIFFSGVGLKYTNNKSPRSNSKPPVRQNDFRPDSNTSPMSQRSPLKRGATAADQLTSKPERTPSPKNETVNVYSVKIPVDLASGEVLANYCLIVETASQNNQCSLADL